MSHLAWLAAILAGAAGVAAAVTRPAVTSAAPRLGAVVEVLALAATGLAPPLLLACAGAAAGTWSGGPGHMLAGICVLAAGPAGPAQLALYGLAVALLARTGAVAARAAGAARRARPRGRALAAATPRRLPGGVTASVVPSGQVAAWCGGLRHPQVVVTTGLLGLLGPAEQQAALAHEAAHIRLGHPRILLFGAVIARSYQWLPPARLAWDRLRRDIEAAADDQAAAAAGTGPLLSALAKVALATTPPATPPAHAGFADPDDLRYRIRRLQAPPARSTRSAMALSLAGAALTGALAAAACQLLRAGAAWPGLIGCLAAFGYLGWRPAWTSPPARPTTSRPGGPRPRRRGPAATRAGGQPLARQLTPRGARGPVRRDHPRDGRGRVAVIERELIGGQCACWVCIPSKTLLRGPEVRAEASRAAGLASPAIDWPGGWLPGRALRCGRQ